MIKTKDTVPVSTSFAGRVATHPSQETQELMALGRRRRWDCAVLGQGPLPDKSVRLGDWLVVPVHHDSSQLPARTLERVQAIFAAGLRPRGFVIVHEAPESLLPPPSQDDSSPPQMSGLPPQVRSALKVAGGVLGALALGIVMVAGLAILAVLVASIAAAVLLPAALLVGAAAIDPILVAVTTDGYWIEIDRWDL